MAKIAEVQEVSLSSLRPYSQNAKIHGEHQLEKLADSIREFGFLTPCLIDRDYNLIAGHGRVMAAQRLGMTSVPCVFIDGLTEEQRRAYILADNRLGDLGEWDMEMVEAELEDLGNLEFDVSLTGFDLPQSWFESRKRYDNDTSEESEEYQEFVDKFEPKRTTDDCYTPDEVYDAVSNFVESEYKISKKHFVRPFYPGGDYQNEKYPSGCVVVDNPPFSILAEIIRFYVDKQISFFLFAPTLTLFSSAATLVTCLPVGAAVTYENGANVSTSFVTNLEKSGAYVKSIPSLFDIVTEANDAAIKSRGKADLPKYSYPDEVITSAMVARWCKYGVDYSLPREDAVVIDALDAQKEAGKAIFGKGFLLSERAAAERAAAERAAAERAAAERAAAERAAAHKWELSDREKSIVKELGHHG